MQDFQKQALEAQLYVAIADHGPSHQLTRMGRSLGISIPGDMSQEAFLTTAEAKVRGVWHNGLIYANKAYAKIAGKEKELAQKLKEAEAKHNSDGLPIDSKLVAKVAAVTAAAAALVGLYKVLGKSSKKAEPEDHSAAPAVPHFELRDEKLPPETVEKLHKKLAEAKSARDEAQKKWEAGYANGRYEKDYWHEMSRQTARIKYYQNIIDDEDV